MAVATASDVASAAASSAWLLDSEMAVTLPDGMRKGKGGGTCNSHLQPKAPLHFRLPQLENDGTN